jgi:hypothetical protein
LFHFGQQTEESSSDYEKEWEKSSAVVDKFDQTVIDLRKLGFSFVTGLIAAGSVFELGLNVQNGIIQATFILIGVLYWLDTYYQNVLVGALLRAQFLEIFRLKYATNYYICGIYNKAKMDSFMTVIYLGLLVSSGIIGFSINIITNTENNTNDVSKLEYSIQNKSTSKSMKIESSVTQRDISKSDLFSFQDKYLSPIIAALTGSILNIVGLLIFLGSVILILFVHREGVRKKKIYEQVNEVYNYFSRLIYQHKDRLEIEIDDIEFFVNRLLYGELERGMHIEQITIRGRVLKDSSIQTVSRVLLLKEPTALPSDPIPYAHWAVISELGILLLVNITERKTELFYFKGKVNTKIFENLNIDREEVDRVNKSYNDLFNSLKIYNDPM